MFSFVGFVGAAFAVASTRLVFAIIPPGCDELDATRDDSDIPPASGAKIDRSFHNRTAIGVSWTISDEDKEGLCGYTFHYYNGSDGGSEVKHTVVKDPNVTQHIVGDLRPGTKYRFYVVSHYASDHAPRSWILATFTKGCGPDMSCSSMNTELCNETTGECVCKPFAFGEYCSQCMDGFYQQNSTSACLSCDHCVSDGISSYGTCKPAIDPLDTMICDCIFPYTGKHCTECTEGYYMDGKRCVPCDCNYPKDNRTQMPPCDPRSGICTCLASHAGEKCEKCAVGYSGNPLADGCVRNQNAGVTALIIIVVIIIVLATAVTCYLTCCHRFKNRLAQRLWKGRDDYDKVNFSTLEEEPESGDVSRNRPSKA